MTIFNRIVLSKAEPENTKDLWMRDNIPYTLKNGKKGMPHSKSLWWFSPEGWRKLFDFDTRYSTLWEENTEAADSFINATEEYDVSTGITSVVNTFNIYDGSRPIGDNSNLVNEQGLKHHVDIIEGEIDSLGGRVDELESDVDTLQSTTETQGNNITELQGKVEELESTTQSHSTQHASQEENINTLQTDVDTLEEKSTIHDSEIESLNTTVTSQGDKLTEQGNQISDLQGEVSTQGDSIEGLQTDLTELEGRVDTLETTVESQGGTIESIQESLTTKEGEINTLKEQLNTQKEDFNEKISALGDVYNIKGTKSTFEELKSDEQPHKKGDVYNIEAEFTLNDRKYPAFTNVVYVGENAEREDKWDALGGMYTLPKAEADILGGVKIGSGITIDESGKISATAASVGATDEAYVNNKVAAVVDSAPEDLNTLKKLSEELAKKADKTTLTEYPTKEEITSGTVKSGRLVNALTFAGAVEATYDGTEAVTVTIPEQPEIPTKLPNPNYLFFDGAVPQIYDGSTKVTVTIPENLEEITYAELKSKRDGSTLTPGMWYRITDYVTTVNSSLTEVRSAKNPFHVIVLATSTNTLSEEARVYQHGFGFDNANQNAWKIWYCLDNDTERFEWADNENGKGVIYRMIDEWNNDCPYDFKNIQFKRYKSTFNSKTSYIGIKGNIGLDNNFINDEDDSIYMYTFSKYSSNIVSDATVEGGKATNNIINLYIDGIKHKLNNIIFINGAPHNNKIGGNCRNMSLHGSDNIIAGNCYNIIYDDYSYANRFDNDCTNIYLINSCCNIFGKNCNYNLLNAAESCIIGNCCSFLSIKPSGSTSLKGTNVLTYTRGDGTSSLLTISPFIATGTPNQQVIYYAGKDSKGKLKVWSPTDLVPEETE